VATRPQQYERATIAHVAREAGVNKGTVSRALRGMGGVGPDTRKRILAAAARLNFSASHLATALATGHSRTIGIVIPTLRSWYFSEVASGASEVLVLAGFRVELINLEVDSDYLEVDSKQFRQLFRELGAERDALLFAGSISTDRGTDEAPRSGRFQTTAAGLPLTSVLGVVDHRAGGRLVGEHLVDLGHRNIAILEGRMPTKPQNGVWQLRTDGFRDAVRAAGFDIHDDMVLSPGDCHPPGGEQGASMLLESGRPLPTAIFCHTDEMAYGAIATFRHAGIRCPDDISVAGFDDHPMSYLWGLTTVTQHAHRQGVRAAKALLGALNDVEDTGNRETSELSVELITRETTRAA
jgi:LacI family transcriptional regulator, repressor for deo operon, udp, cdd, tsx, nupC, and nupG